MSILYFHGLDRPANDREKALLSRYGRLIAPEIDYQPDPNFIQFMRSVYSKTDLKAIVGLSMGGLVAYSLSRLLEKPCMLFNPTLGYAKVMEYHLGEPQQNNQYLRVVLGGKDKVVDPFESYNIIQEYAGEQVDVSIKPLKGHDVDLESFEVETRIFFEKIKAQKQAL